MYRRCVRRFCAAATTTTASTNASPAEASSSEASAPRFPRRPPPSHMPPASTTFSGTAGSGDAPTLHFEPQGTSSAQHPLTKKALTPQALLQCIRRNPGLTSTYYATRYFPDEDPRTVNHMLWVELKRFGHVVNDRTSQTVGIGINDDGNSSGAIGVDNNEPRWVPNHDRPFRMTKVLNKTVMAERSAQLTPEEKAELEQRRAQRAAKTQEAREAAIRKRYEDVSSTIVSSPSKITEAVGAPLTPLQKTILQLVKATPGHGIAHYVNQLPEDCDRTNAALEFRALLQQHLLLKETNEAGVPVWTAHGAKQQKKEQQQE